MFGSMGGNSGIGGPISPNQIGGESFIRHVSNDKLIFDFKEGSGTTVRDKSHNNNDGTLGAGVAAPTWKRNSLYFDGGDELTTTIPNANLTSGTISIGLRPNDNITTNQRVFYSASETRTEIMYNDDGTFSFSNNNAGWTEVNSIKDDFSLGVKYLFLLNWNGVKNNIYINGVFDNSVNDDAGEVDLGIIQIGHRLTQAYFTGTMYSLRILNKGLSGVEAQQEYLSQKFRGNN